MMAVTCQHNDGNLLFPHPRPSPATKRCVLTDANLAGEGGRLGVRRVRRLPCGRSWPTSRKAGTPRKSMLPEIWVCGTDRKRTLGERESFVCGIPPVRIGAGVTPHGKTADAPYSRLRPPAGVRGRLVHGGHMPTQ